VVFTKGAYDLFVAGPAKGRSVTAVATSTEAEADAAAVAAGDEEDAK
jgi:large subunit ribosomal protein L4